MEIKWYGHSAFLLTDANNNRVMMDPCNPPTGYTLANIDADIITCSHRHDDHNYVKAVNGTPQIITTPGVHAVNGLRITGIPTFHDEAGGIERGENIMFIVEMDGMRIMHCGDLGHVLEPETLKKLGPVDVMLVPVGGYYTVDSKVAAEVVRLVRPSVTIPMHYKTDACRVDVLAGISPFISAMNGFSIHKLNQNVATLTTDSLDVDRVLVLDYN